MIYHEDMVERSGDSAGLVAGPEKGDFRWDRLLAWVPLAAMLGLLVAWAAVVIEGYFAPFLLFPLVVGVILGGTVVLAMRVGQVGHRPTIWLGALVAASVLIAGQHYLAFKVELRRSDRDPKRAATQLLAPERIPPARFGEYLKWRAASGVEIIPSHIAHGALVWLAWTVDAALVLVPALFLVGATARLPYCNRCRRWLQTVRSGRLDPGTAGVLARLAGLAKRGQEPRTAGKSAASEYATRERAPDHFSRARYRLLACQGGCGPTGFVLSWDDPAGRLSSGVVWLDATGRDRVVEILERSGRYDGQQASIAENGARNAEIQPPEMGP